LRKLKLDILRSGPMSLGLMGARVIEPTRDQGSPLIERVAGTQD